MREISSYGNIDPQIDLIAAYTRETGNEFQFRLDFLDLMYESDLELYLALDTKPGGSNRLPTGEKTDIEWETLIYIPPDGPPQTFIFKPSTENESTDSSNNEIVPRRDLIPRIVRIPWQDYIMISINKNLIATSEPRFNLQAFSASSNSSNQRDKIGPFSFSGPNPLPAPLVLAFWDTFPAYTPAQALRRWDGAHTGPFGERHGLSILLNNVKKSEVPVVLLDLRNPASLSAIDALDGLPQILEMESRKLIILPDIFTGSPGYPLFPNGLPDWAAGFSLQYNNAVSRNFGLNSNQILYAPENLDTSFPGYSITFTDSSDNDHPISREKNPLPIPFQTPDEQQATPDGLTLPIRMILLDNALSLNHGETNLPVLILGGSLAESAFGDPQSSQAALSYISNHPWMDPLDSAQLLTLPREINPQVLPGVTSSVQIDSYSPSEVLQTLLPPEDNSQNQLYLSAWQAAYSLYAPLPPEPADLARLRSNYSGQPGITLAAARWADNPGVRASCSDDHDRDGSNECILSSLHFFAEIDLAGGRLLTLYYKSGETLHQVITQSSQFITGLSDPSSWKLETGEAADPGGIHGAFADRNDPWQNYQVSVSENNITLISPDGLTEKIFQLYPEGLHTSINSQLPVTTQIPLAIDPWIRFSPGWKHLYQGKAIPGGYRLIFSNDIQVELQTDAQLSAASFTDSPATYDISEDPNLNYPAGHYIPYPMVIIELQSEGNFNLDIKVAEDGVLP